MPSRYLFFGLGGLGKSGVRQIPSKNIPYIPIFGGIFPPLSLIVTLCLELRFAGTPVEVVTPSKMRQQLGRATEEDVLGLIRDFVIKNGDSKTTKVREAIKLKKRISYGNLP